MRTQSLLLAGLAATPMVMAYEEYYENPGNQGTTAVAPEGSETETVSWVTVTVVPVPVTESSIEATSTDVLPPPYDENSSVESEETSAAAGTTEGYESGETTTVPAEAITSSEEATTEATAEASVTESATESETDEYCEPDESESIPAEHESEVSPTGTESASVPAESTTGAEESETPSETDEVSATAPGSESETAPVTDTPTGTTSVEVPGEAISSTPTGDCDEEETTVPGYTAPGTDTPTGTTSVEVPGEAISSTPTSDSYEEETTAAVPAETETAPGYTAPGQETSVHPTSPGQSHPVPTETVSTPVQPESSPCEEYITVTTYVPGTPGQETSVSPSVPAESVAVPGESDSPNESVPAYEEETPCDDETVTLTSTITRSTPTHTAPGNGPGEEGEGSESSNAPGLPTTESAEVPIVTDSATLPYQTGSPSTFITGTAPQSVPVYSSGTIPGSSVVPPALSQTEPAITGQPTETIPPVFAGASNVGFSAVALFAAAAVHFLL